jgi:hypothetical protein
MNRFIHNLLKDLAELIHGAIDRIGLGGFILLVWLVIVIGICLTGQYDKSAVKQAAGDCQPKERQ